MTTSAEAQRSQRPQRSGGRVAARPSPTTGVARLDLPPTAASVAKARAFVRACCSVDGLTSSVSETVVLLTSEAVTQAVATGRERVSVAFSADLAGTTGPGGRGTWAERDERLGVLVEVTEPGVHRPRTRALTGGGTAVLDALALAWGVRRSTTETTLWFRVAEPLPSPRPSTA